MRGRSYATRRYSDDDVQAALADLTNGMAFRDVCAKHSVPPSTLRLWRRLQIAEAKGRGQPIQHPSLPAPTAIPAPDRRAVDWIAELRDAAHLAMDRALAALPDADTAAATRAFSAFYDRLALLEGRVTSRSEVVERHSAAMDALVARLGAAFAELARERVGDGGDVLDAEFADAQPAAPAELPAE